MFRLKYFLQIKLMIVLLLNFSCRSTSGDQPSKSEFLNLPTISEASLNDRIDLASRNNLPIVIDVYLLGPGRSGGIDAGYNILNISGRIIQSIVLTFRPRDQEGSIVHEKDRRKTVFNGIIKGPIGIQEKKSNQLFNNVWYSSNIACIELLVAELKYLDGGRKIVSDRKKLEAMRGLEEKFCR